MTPEPCLCGHKPLTAADLTAAMAELERIAFVPNQPKTPRRTFRIPDELYGRAQAKAEAENQTVSDVIRRALEAYVANAPTSGTNRE